MLLWDTVVAGPVEKVHSARHDAVTVSVVCPRRYYQPVGLRNRHLLSRGGGVGVLFAERGWRAFKLTDLRDFTRHLFGAADQLWTKSALRPDQYAQPVLALIALRQMESRSVYLYPLNQIDRY